MARPTIIIGYGAFGRDAMERLLRQSALRGVLNWEENARGSVVSAQRQLKDIALVALDDPGAPSTRGIRAAESGEAQFLADLYRQIRSLPATAEAREETVAQFVGDIADEFMTPDAEIDPDDETTALGLDLIVLARPARKKSLQRLDLLLEAILDQLQDSPYFRTGNNEGANLSCIEILDFDNYWQRGDAADALRAALRGSVEDWEHRRATARAASVDRCYIVDGRSDAGRRDAALRLDEVALFLELLLFEGLRRSGGLPELFQLLGGATRITATFGVRLLEESSAFLSRQAGATLGQGWLGFLIGDAHPSPDRIAQKVRERIRDYAPGRLEANLNEQELEATFEAGCAELEKALLAVAKPDDPGWPERLDEAFQKRRLDLEQRLNEVAWNSVGTLRKDQLEDIDKKMAQAVETDLHNPLEPVSLKAVLTEIQGLNDSLGNRRREAMDTAEEEDPLKRPRRTHRRYGHHSGEWLAGGGAKLHRFWPLFAALLALGLAPLLDNLFFRIPEPSKTSLLYAIWEGFDTVSHPLFWALLCFVPIWLAGAWPWQRNIRTDIRRARGFYMDDSRGRFHDAVRALIDPLRDRLLERVRRGMRASLANDVSKSLARINEHLLERQAEMLWLRTQLDEFLKLHSTPRTAVRQSADLPGANQLLPEDLSELDERYRSVQPHCTKPFEGWNERFCESFLDPLDFIESLSKEFEQQLTRGSASGDRDVDREALADALKDFLKRRFDLACQFARDADSLDNEKRLCIAAPSWRQLPGIESSLFKLDINETLDSKDTSRLYVLSLRNGIRADRLAPNRGVSGEPS